MNSKVYFNVIAGQWDSMRREFFSESVREKAYRAANTKTGQSAADIGAGTGFITEGLLGQGLSVIAVDQSPEMLEQLSKKFPNSNLNCREGTAEHLPVEDHSVDKVFANMFLHHVEEPLTAIREMVRILKPGGQLIITDIETHLHEFLRTEQHDRWLGFDLQKVSEWFDQAGLEDVDVQFINESCCGTSACGCDQANIPIWIASGIKPPASAFINELL
jgi:ubiquinone/menaquinone biosynthesis C-methylase UbiE